MTTETTNLNISIGARTERGRRQENQDNMTGFNSSFGAVYVIADGIGGHRGGAEASRMVVEGYHKYLTAFPASMPLEEALQRATSAVNAEMRMRADQGDAKLAGMGSTVVLAIVNKNSNGTELVVGHVGDSRAYVLRGGTLRLLTRDHTAVQRMVDANMIRPEEARKHPDASVLTRAMGQQPEVSIEVDGPELLEPDDVVLLCSDGLSGYVPDHLIEREINSHQSASETANALTELALRSGSDDNVTVQILRAKAETPVAVIRPEAARSNDTKVEPRRRLLFPLIASHLAAAVAAAALGVNLGARLLVPLPPIQAPFPPSAPKFGYDEPAHVKPAKKGDDESGGRKKGNKKRAQKQDQDQAQDQDQQPPEGLSGPEVNNDEIPNGNHAGDSKPKSKKKEETGEKQ
jgi:PPM family protein phosphatase